MLKTELQTCRKKGIHKWFNAQKIMKRLSTRTTLSPGYSVATCENNFKIFTVNINAFLPSGPLFDPILVSCPKKKLPHCYSSR